MPTGEVRQEMPVSASAPTIEGADAPPFGKVLTPVNVGLEIVGLGIVEPEGIATYKAPSGL
jgi:hypothetical protein